MRRRNCLGAVLSADSYIASAWAPLLGKRCKQTTTAEWGNSKWIPQADYGLFDFPHLMAEISSKRFRPGYFWQSPMRADSKVPSASASNRWPPLFATANPNSHIMMVLALSRSDFTSSRCRAAKVWHSSAAKSIGFFVLGFTAESASIRLSVGLSLHSASSANPKPAKASPYITWAPDFATEYPNNHIMVLMGSVPGAGLGEAITSF